MQPYRRSVVFPAIGLLGVGLMVGCHNNYEMPAPKSPPAVMDPNLQVSLQTSPRPLRQMDPVTFTVRISDSEGRPVPQARVGVGLTMPAMDMGRNAVALAPTAPGVYRGTGRFSMDGDWVVVVTAARGMARSVRSFPLHVH